MPNSIKLNTFPWVKEIQVCSNKEPGPLQRGDNHKNIKKHHLQNHWVNFNQTWNRSFLGGWGSSLFTLWPNGDKKSSRGDTCNRKRVKIH
jgi:hypothetical protein